MIRAFGDSQAFAAPGNVTFESTPLRLAAGSFTADDDFLRVWQISNGRHLAFVTYTCAWTDKGVELSDCEQIVRSLQFNSPKLGRRRVEKRGMGGAASDPEVSL
jgi:hypothetical protein